MSMKPGYRKGKKKDLKKRERFVQDYITIDYGDMTQEETNLNCLLTGNDFFPLKNETNKTNIPHHECIKVYIINKKCVCVKQERELKKNKPKDYYISIIDVKRRTTLGELFFLLRTNRSRLKKQSDVGINLDVEIDSMRQKQTD